MFSEYNPVVFADVQVMEENPRYVPIQRAAVVAHSYPNPLSGKQYKVMKMF